MRFEHEGKRYRLVFQRDKVYPLSGGPVRMQTQVMLLDVTKDEYIEHIEIGRATVRGYFKDPVTREAGRRCALRRMTPFVPEALRPKMWDAYLNRAEQAAVRWCRPDERAGAGQ